MRVKIIKKFLSNKKEDAMVAPFLEYLYEESSEQISFFSIPEGRGSRPDYFVDSKNTLVEIKEIHDKSSNDKFAQWGSIVNRLQKATNNHKLFDQVKGTYFVGTPEVFKLWNFETVSEKILKSVIEGIDDKKTITILGISFEIKKINDQGKIVAYGSIGKGTSIDPAGVIHFNIKNKIETANEQLRFNPDNKVPAKRILLLVNKYHFLIYDWDLFKAIAMSYGDLLRYDNIDEIWYQTEAKNQTFIHKLLYRKSFFTAFEDGNLKVAKRDEYKMFASWFSVLSDMGDDKKDKLFKVLQSFLVKNKASTIFTENGDREQMVRLGLWLIENKRIEDAEWLINQFIEDPDPPEPGNYQGKPEFNYDQIIRDGKDVVILTTVMGHLSWDVKELASNSERHNIANLVKAYNYTEKILTHKKNLYLIQQWLIPLIEIANKRLWIAEEDVSTYKSFRELILDRKSGLIAKYSQYPAIAKLLIDILDFFRDLTSEEFKFVLSKMISFEEISRLLIFFALYRDRHYKKDSEAGQVLGSINPLIFNYSPEYAKDQLNTISLDKENRYASLRSNIVWQLWKILDDLPGEFDHLKDVLNNLFNSPYDKKVFKNLYHILDEEYEGETEQCHIWLIEYLNKLSNYAVNDEKGRGVWIDISKIINLIVNYNPQDLPFILNKLTEMWMKGAYIGDLNIIFTAYQIVKDKKLKQEIKKLSQELHKKIQKVNTNVRDIDWI